MASTNEDSTIKGSMWELDQNLDQPMDEEAGRFRDPLRDKKLSALLLLRLSFQSLGVVFGDLGTSPLYVFYNTFPHEIQHPEDVIGALSLIIYSLTLIPLLKYVFIVCRANDNGQGGTFALYSLLCRHADVNTIPNRHRTDEQLTTYSRNKFHENSLAAKTKGWLEKHSSRKNGLLLLVIVGTCMEMEFSLQLYQYAALRMRSKIRVEEVLISDQTQVSIPGLTTPIPDLGWSKPRPVMRKSPKKGLNKAYVWEDVDAVLIVSLASQTILWQADVVVLVAALILLGLFSLQRYGTDKVGWLFAPIVLTWLLMIGGIGAYNIWKYDGSVLRAFSPVYMYRYLKRGGKDRWTSLGGIMLSITGTETLFADLAYFPVVAIQIAFTVVVFPCLLLAYAGQAAYLINHQHHVVDAFYHSIPGTAVVIVMLATTFLMIPIMLLVWRCHWVPVVVFTILSLVIELTYFSAVLFKVNQGGWVPLAIAGVFSVIMVVWHYGTVKRYEFEMHSKVSMAWILGLGPSLGLVRVPGIGLVYTELASGVPHIFSHFITNLPAIHSAVVFVCVKYLPVYTVPEDERFLVKRIGTTSFHMFRCVARYGYKDLHKKDDDFEEKLFHNLFLFVRLESMMDGCTDSDEYSSVYGHQTAQSRDFLLDSNHVTSDVNPTTESGDSIVPASSPLRQTTVMMRSLGQTSSQNEVDELEFLKSCRDAGVVHILGNTVVKARRDSRFYKKIAVDYIYAFLRKICRENSVILSVPHETLLNVGQIYYV
ncbi:LOW QUALITY PROTEIN: hypothetical protein Cgig2_021172 [Carnegiea gigantea]|uniref:Potassium transporter n=1 Tax=Carnegiea gigantea TaxID=171969 RepID=A0A9Q1KX53_9CARY|nr:LOW QUALITY PROTEIN: hypothetical protein Cgig2_021172 [Carnegiea gigantea]